MRRPGWKCDDIDQPRQGLADVDAGRIGPEAIVEDHGDAANGHGCQARQVSSRRYQK